MKWRIALLVVVLLSAMYALTGVFYSAWLSATPLTPERLKQVKHENNLWTLLPVALLMAAVALVVSMVARRRRR